jgi:hypothetical protein
LQVLDSQQFAAAANAAFRHENLKVEALSLLLSRVTAPVKVKEEPQQQEVEDCVEDHSSKTRAALLGRPVQPPEWY